MEWAKFNKHTPKWYVENVSDIFADVPFGYLLIFPDQKIKQVNQTLLDWLGCDREALTSGKKFSELLSLGGRFYYETHHRPVEELQGYINEQNYTLLGSNGKRIPVLISTMREKDETGNLLFTQLFITKIATRKKYEQDLIQAKKAADSAVEAKTKFISMISHELRTPLQALIGMSSILLQKQPREDQLSLLQNISFASTNLLELLNHILDFSRSEREALQLDFNPFLFRKLIQQTVASLQFVATEKELTFSTWIDERIPEYLIGDAPKISQVLNNILGNAIKFTPAGFIEIRAKLVEQLNDHVLVHFAIEDSGIGISPGAIGKIFDSFSQGHAEGRFNGAGLGLAISQNLLRLHQSEIKVESEEGKGSIFSFTLPFRVADQVERKQLLRVRTLERITNMKVLLVEDNQSNIFIISRYFEQWKLDFDVAESGAAALEMIQQKPYNLVLMDLQMPGMNGFDTIRALRSMKDEAYRSLPVVALSASAFPALEKKMLDAGFHNYLSKPFDPEELHALLRSVSLGESIVLSPTVKPDLHASVHLNEGVLDFTGLRDLMEGDEAAIKQFIGVVLKDWGQILKELKTAVITKDPHLFSQAKHKTISTVELFKAGQLKELLAQANTKMKSPETYELDDPLFKELFDVFDTIIEGLQTFLLPPA